MATLHERIEAFDRDYQALCAMHGLIIAYDGGYIAREVIELPEDEFDDEWSLRSAD